MGAEIKVGNGFIEAEVKGWNQLRIHPEAQLLHDLYAQEAAPWQAQTHAFYEHIQKVLQFAKRMKHLQSLHYFQNAHEFRDAEGNTLEKIIVRGGQKLNGTVKVEGAKNAVLPVIAASLLASEEKSVICDVPTRRYITNYAFFFTC